MKIITTKEITIVDDVQKEPTWDIEFNNYRSGIYNLIAEEVEELRKALNKIQL